MGMFTVKLKNGAIHRFKAKVEAEQFAASKGSPLVYYDGFDDVKPIMYTDDRELCVMCKSNFGFECHFDVGVQYLVRSYSAGTKNDFTLQRANKSTILGIEDRFGKVVEISKEHFVIHPWDEVMGKKS